MVCALTVVAPAALASSSCASADYEVERCDPRAANLELDVCNRLNAGLASTECSVWQCDSASSRCTLRARDQDRDGEPTTACGGRDCDDRNPEIGAKAEVCDGLDNDCDGVVDDGVIGPAAAPTDLFKVEQATPRSDPSITAPGGGEALAEGDSSRTPVAVYVGAATPSGACLKTSPLVVKDPPSSCAFLAAESNLAPRVPSVRGFGPGQAAVFVATSLCPQGGLQYRFAAPGQTPVSAGIACGTAPAAKGTAFPNVEIFEDATVAAIAYYDEPLPDLESSGFCDAISAAPAPLHVIGMTAPTSAPAVQLTGGQPLVLTTAARSRGRPAMARVDRDVPEEEAVVVASPDGPGASLWLITKGTDGLVASAPTPIAGMDDARSISLGVARTSSEVRIAAVSDIGCAAQEIRISFGRYAVDGGRPVAAMDPAVTVASGADRDRVRPVARWLEQAGLWIVAWIETGGEVRARRYSKDGAPLEEAFSLTTGASAVDVALDGRVVFFTPNGGVNASAFRSVSLGCGSR